MKHDLPDGFAITWALARAQRFGQGRPVRSSPDGDGSFNSQPLRNTEFDASAGEVNAGHTVTVVTKTFCLEREQSPSCARIEAVTVRGCYFTACEDQSLRQHVYQGGGIPRPTCIERNQETQEMRPMGIVSHRVEKSPRLCIEGRWSPPSCLEHGE